MKKLLHFLILTLITLCFSGCWGRGWLMPYAFQPSFHKFKEICQLDPEIYQANGGKLDEEYYNKALKYFDTSLDTMSDIKTLRISDDKKHFSYMFEKWIGDRISFDFIIWFKDKKATKDNIKKVSVYVWWRDLRPRLAGNEGTGIHLSGGRENCDYFKKGINNEK